MKTIKASCRKANIIQLSVFSADFYLRHLVVNFVYVAHMSEALYWQTEITSGDDFVSDKK